MKKLSLLALACALASFTLAEDAAKKDSPSNLTLPASAAKLTPPLELKDGAISNPQRTELADGGKAVFEFTAPKDGSYVIHAVASAADDEANSFFVNIDAAPADEMIWDIEVTNGFEERVVNWRGNGESGNGEFVPKVFKLTAGKHQLIFVGRETSQLKSVSIRPATK